MTVPYTEVIAETTVWVEATAVRCDSQLTISLTETTGGGARTGSIAVGTYTKTTFASTLQAVLNSISANGYTYTVVSDTVNYLGLPNTSPTKWGSSFSITKNGTGNFVLIIS